MALRFGRNTVWIVVVIAVLTTMAWSLSKREPLPPFVTTITFE